MTKTVILYTGSCEAGDVAHERLEHWSAAHSDIHVERRSVHDDPTAVVRLGITRVPALVVDDEVLAQGSPDLWLTDGFLQALGAH
jgi:predicted DsbA family dithiol-disulfide isomerase